MDRKIDGANVRFPPPLIYLAGLVLGVAATPIFHLRPLGSAPILRNAGGGVLVAAGFLICFAAVRLFVKQRTAIIPYKPANRLVTSGIYRWTRNPMYLGLALAYMGFAGILNNVGTVVLFPAVLAIIQLQVIAREETYLERTFGREFVAYKSRVRRWV